MRECAYANCVPPEERTERHPTLEKQCCSYLQVLDRIKLSLLQNEWCPCWDDVRGGSTRRKGEASNAPGPGEQQQGSRRRRVEQCLQNGRVQCRSLAGRRRIADSRTMPRCYTLSFSALHFFCINEYRFQIKNEST